MAKRLKTEALDLATNPLDWGSAEPVGGDLFKWTASVLGPDSSPYRGGVFTLQIAVPTDYPFRAPEVMFQTKVYHPNVKTDSGEICADILKEQWKPTLSIRWVLEVIRTMLDSPSIDSPLESEIAAQLKDNPKAFQATAADWTKKYAS
jgi:ubiquitin-conjugating enzyme E2 D/E